VVGEGRGSWRRGELTSLWDPRSFSRGETQRTELQAQSRCGFDQNRKRRGGKEERDENGAAVIRNDREISAYLGPSFNKETSRAGRPLRMPGNGKLEEGGGPKGKRKIKGEGRMLGGVITRPRPASRCVAADRCDFSCTSEVLEVKSARGTGRQGSLRTKGIQRDGGLLVTREQVCIDEPFDEKGLKGGTGEEMGKKRRASKLLLETTSGKVGKSELSRARRLAPVNREIWREKEVGERRKTMSVNTDLETKGAIGCSTRPPKAETRPKFIVLSQLRTFLTKSQRWKTNLHETTKRGKHRGTREEPKAARDATAKRKSKGKIRVQ